MTEPAPKAWLPRPLRALAGRTLQTVLNHVVSLDPETQAALEPLDGRSVQLHLRGPELKLSVQVQGSRLVVGPAPETATDGDLAVSATPGSLLAMALRRNDDRAAPGRVALSGDADLARRLERLATRFAPDWEEAFARSFGDVLGVPLARALQRGLAHARTSVRHVAEDGADWLRDEARLAVPQGELDGFLDDVDALRERTERLDARLARLAARGANR